MPNPILRRRNGHPTVAAVAAFSPLSLPNLILWWKADALGLTDGTAVATWTDSGPAGNSGTGAGSPTFKTNILNGLPIVRFSNSNVDKASFTTLTQPTVIFVVFASTSLATTQVPWDGIIATGRNASLVTATTGVVSIYAGSLVSGAASVGTGFNVYSFVYNGASSAIRRNGVAYASGNAGAQVLTGFRLGKDNGGINPLVGDVAEVFISQSNLSAGTIHSAEQYLGSKYAITVS